MRRKQSGGEHRRRYRFEFYFPQAFLLVIGASSSLRYRIKATWRLVLAGVTELRNVCCTKVTHENISLRGKGAREAQQDDSGMYVMVMFPSLATG